MMSAQMLDGESVAGTLRRLKADKENFSIDNFNKVPPAASPQRLTLRVLGNAFPRM